MDFSPFSRCAHCTGQITLCTASLYSVNNSVTWIAAKTFFAGLTVALISPGRTCLSQVPVLCAWPATTGPKYPSRVNEAPSAQSCRTYCCQVGRGKEMLYTFWVCFPVLMECFRMWRLPGLADPSAGMYNWYYAERWHHLFFNLANFVLQPFWITCWEPGVNNDKAAACLVI